MNEYFVYTEEEMDGFVDDGSIHTIIRTAIDQKQLDALCDLITYTDTCNPDVLADALNELPYEDKLWFLTNHDVITTMYPATYTNILSNWRSALSDTMCPQRILTAFTDLLNSDTSDTRDIIRLWLTSGNCEEIIDIVSELDPKYVFEANVEGLLFEFIEQLLFEISFMKSASLKEENLLISQIQTCLDMLGHYTSTGSKTKRCDKKIITAYSAICGYLNNMEEEHLSTDTTEIYIMFVNQFHEDDMLIFTAICKVINRFPPTITLTTGYGGFGLFLECVRFDLPDMLETMLRKYNITPETLHEDQYNYKLIAKLLFATVSSVPRNGCLEFFQESGYITAYQSWFRGARYEELEIISGCDWPLVAFSIDTKNDLTGIWLRDYQGVGLVLQFLRMNDLTNTGEIQTEQTDHIMSVWRGHNVQPFTDAESELTNELTKYLRGRQYTHTPNLVRNKLYQLEALTKCGFVSRDIYDVLAQEVFILYLLHAMPAEYDNMEITELFTEYRPVYTLHYWMALLLSDLTPATLGFTETVQVLLKQYPDFAAKNPHTPSAFVDMILQTLKEYKPQCLLAPMTAKTATVIKLFYPTGDCDGTVNSSEILYKLSNIKFGGNINNIYLLVVISRYSKKTGFEFQLSELLVEKLLEEIPGIARFGLDRLVVNSVFTNYCYILSRHTDLATGRRIMHAILNDVFMNNTNISIEQIINPFQYEEETPENIGYMRAALTDSDFILGDAGPNSYVKYVIRPTQEYVKKQEISRRRNWCASRQIQCSTLELTEISDPESLEFICPITFEPQKVGDWVIKLTECGHKFSSGAIMEWCRENTTCPVCRADLGDGKLSGANCEMLELV
jgi:hypothetical protein